MKFVKVRYEGQAPYTDRTALKNAWEPGDEKLVSEADARLLSRYLEFKRVTDEKADPKKDAKGKKADVGEQAALEQAQQAQAQAAAKEKAEKNAVEETLVEVSVMTKEALEAYARQNYGLELDKRRSVETLRNQVIELVQGGVA